MRPWHLSTSSTTRHPLFPSEALRRQAVRTIARVCGDELVEFWVVDDHVHVIVLCDRARSGVLARMLKLALRPIAAVPLKPVYIGAIHGRNHMEDTHRYLLRQCAHHGLSQHPALWSGGCFLDLAGARRIPGLQLRLSDVLPRWSLSSSCSVLGLRLADLAPATDDMVRAAGARALASAAATACAAAPELEGRRAETCRARRAACVLAGEVALPMSEMSWALGTHPGSTRKLSARRVDPELLLTVRRTLALEHAVRKAPPQPGAPGRKERA
jgi:REP element-mobilizing transposase RayT